LLVMTRASDLPPRSLLLTAVLALYACELGPEKIVLPPLPPRDAAAAPLFVCEDESSVACQLNSHLSCQPNGEFLQVHTVDCSAMDKICHLDRVCITCSPTSYRCQPCERDDEDCDPNVVQQCDENGDAWHDVKTCDLQAGDVCIEGGCENMCKLAERNRSYVGCEFYAADLDNAAIDDLNNASAQQFAVAVANPQAVAVEVTVEINDAPYGEPVEAREIDRVTVAPGALEVFELPRREVDGSSEEGLNDGTHTALSSNAFRVWSSHPITAYQFNPLENVNVFSNDASLLLPTSAIGPKYTVVAWPQTIGDSENPDQDFDSTSRDEDLRAFLTIIGTQDGTRLKVRLGPVVEKVVGLEPGETWRAGELIERDIGRYDVLNLETEAFNGDFTGTIIEADQAVTVFVGSEASDVPIFGTYATRQCCADHLEEQLIPDSTVGTRYSVARMPPRTRALADAAFEDDPLSIAIVNEPEWVRVIAIAEGTTVVTTTLPPPDNEFTLEQGEEDILRADQDFLLDADQPVSVLQALPSQGVTGIPREYPGGDPDLVVVPPIQQYRRDYVFLTPDKYAFDFVTIMAENGTEILLDGEPLPDHCTTSPADGLEHGPGDPEPERVIHRCQLSFPKVPSRRDAQPFAGEQHDGVHTLVANREIGIVVYGFDRFVSYAYVGGLNLDIIN
jgi:hypothetical protein